MILKSSARSTCVCVVCITPSFAKVGDSSECRPTLRSHPAGFSRLPITCLFMMDYRHYV